MIHMPQTHFSMDAMALRVPPGVTVRRNRPHFLTPSCGCRVQTNTTLLLPHVNVRSPERYRSCSLSVSHTTAGFMQLARPQNTGGLIMATSCR